MVLEVPVVVVLGEEMGMDATGSHLFQLGLVSSLSCACK